MVALKDRYVCDAIASIYERSLDDANNIIARAQNPLTALCLIIAMMIYMAQVIYTSQIPKINLENATIVGSFYLLLTVTLFCVVQTIYYLWRGFRFGGYKYETVGTPKQIVSLANKLDEQELLINLISQYQCASERNIQNNKERLEYIRVATERIIMAVAFCFSTSFLFCIIMTLSSVGR